MADTKLSPCGHIIKKYDPDRFLTCLFAPEAEREALFAIYAFNYEIAKTRGTVSEPMLGQIRLQWWREAIEECFDKEKQRRHEVVQSLCKAIKTYNLTRAHFDTLIDARENDFDNEKFSDLNKLAYYAAMTSAPLLWLACEVFDKRSDTVKVTAEAIGTAWAMLGLMRATPFLIQTGSDALPREILKKHGIKGPPAGPSGFLNETVKEICFDISKRLKNAETPKDCYCPPLLHKTLAKQYLKQFAKAGFDPFSSTMETPSMLRIPCLYMANLLQRL